MFFADGARLSSCRSTALAKACGSLLPHLVFRFAHSAFSCNLHYPKSLVAIGEANLLRVMVTALNRHSRFKIMTKLVAISALTVALTVASARPADTNAQFEKLAREYIEAYLAGHPETATELGDHRFDDRLTDYSAAAREKQLKLAGDVRKQLDAFKDGAGLSPENKIDAQILAENLDREIFELSELKEPDWNPLVYTRSLAESLYLLVARDFDTPQKRMESLRKRLEAIPAVIEQAKKNLKNPPRVHTATAIDQARGAADLMLKELDPLLDQVPGAKKDTDALRAKTGMEIVKYMKWLIDDVLPKAKGDFRLGPDKFQKKLRFALGSDLSMDEIQKRAKADFDQTKAAMYETALPLYKNYFPS